MATPPNNSAFRWNEHVTQSGKPLGETPVSCNEIVNLVMTVVKSNPEKAVLAFEGQLTTFACTQSLQDKLSNSGFASVVCLNPREAKEKLRQKYDERTCWHPYQHQIFVINKK